MRALAAGLLLGTLHCAPQTLQGSLNELLSLNYANADLAVVNGQAALRFLRPVPVQDSRADAGVANAEDLVLKVAVVLQGQTVAPHVYFDLAAALPNGAQVGQLTRNVLSETTMTFPSIDRGLFYVRQVPVSGSHASGYFTVTFTDGILPASGHTVYGSFDAVVL